VARKVYCAGENDYTGDAEVIVVDGQGDTVLARLTVGSYPTSTAVNPLDNKVYVSGDYSTVTIIDCAAETRTIIELNCSPMRLDMDWRWWKRARDKGVLCSINPDAHHINGLHHLGLGIRIARKGWLRRQDVLNTRSLTDVLTFLKSPKAQRS
jgi:hypothetical protein